MTLYALLLETAHEGSSLLGVYSSASLAHTAADLHSGGDYEPGRVESLAWKRYDDVQDAHVQLGYGEWHGASCAMRVPGYTRYVVVPVNLDHAARDHETPPHERG